MSHAATSQKTLTASVSQAVASRSQPPLSGCVTTACPRHSGAPTPCDDEAVAGSSLAADWATSPEAIGMLVMLHELSALADRMDALLVNRPGLSDAREARSLIGRVVTRQIDATWNRGRVLSAGPSNGCCAVHSLWTELESLRRAAIDAQLEREGYRGVPSGLLTDGGMDRRMKLDDEAPSVADALAAMGQRS
ncbi:hypothetical protein [Sphingomonas sp.]|uniref:hypothetical protein n=1 Tax=Sphingomonas sp. TaxID=28214 RepID=UPI00307E4BCC